MLLSCMLSFGHKVTSPSFWSGTCFEYFLGFLVNEVKMEWQGKQCSFFIKYHLYLLLHQHVAGLEFKKIPTISF